MKAVLPRSSAAVAVARRHISRAVLVPAVSSDSSSSRPFSVLNRPPPNYPGHVPLTGLERAGLAIGSGLMSLINPRRGGEPLFFLDLHTKASIKGQPLHLQQLTLFPFPENHADLIAAFAEATATPYFIYRLRDAMLADPTGRRILRDRPRLTSASLDLPRLRALAPRTVGATYAAWLDREGVSPDTRAAVRYIDDEEAAYVMQRYRECHDFYHALTGLPVVREGEVALKAFEFANTLLPMTGLSVAAAATLKRPERARFASTYLPWAVRNGLRARDVINVYWEEELETDVAELRRRLNVEAPPDMRSIRKREREERKRRKALMEQR